MIVSWLPQKSRKLESYLVHMQTVNSRLFFVILKSLGTRLRVYLKITINIYTSMYIIYIYIYIHVLL